jgi:hypothetical protein
MSHPISHPNLTHPWQYFRKGEQYFRTPDTIREVTGRNPQSLKELFRANAESFGSQAAGSKSI